MFRSYALATACTLSLLTGCAASTSDTIDDSGDGQEQDVTGKIKYHYEPSVSDVHLAYGCGVIDPKHPQPDCSFGFVLRYTKSYADLTAAVTHSVDLAKHTITVKLDTWSYSKIHALIAVSPQNETLGLLGATPGQKYTVTVVDRKGDQLWSGKLTAPYHL